MRINSDFSPKLQSCIDIPIIFNFTINFTLSCFIVTFVLSTIRNLVSISLKNEPLLVSQIRNL